MSAAHLYNPSSIGFGSYRILGSVERDLSEENLQRLKYRLNEQLNNYPELNNRTVTVGKKREEDTWYAEADWTNDIIFLPTHELCPRLTICHELSHLAINIIDEQWLETEVPKTSEEFCSIFTVARMDPASLDRASISYLGTPSVPREQWPAICQRALEYRENHRNYIQKCKEWLQI